MASQGEGAGEGLSPLERVLRLFTDVRPGEGPTALAMFANVFLILCAYYFIKPLREGWLAISEIEGLTKMEVKAYSSFGQSLLLLGVVAVYAPLAHRWHRVTLVTRSTVFCMAVLAAFWLAQPGFLWEHLPASGVVFYLWVGIFGVFVVAQFWAFAADLYTDERGRRLIPMVAIGATGGAAAGSTIVEGLVGTGLVAGYDLLLAACVPLAGALWLTRVADRRGPEGGGRGDPRARGEPMPPDTRGAMEIILRHRYLLFTALITLLLNWVNTNGENLLFRVVQDVLGEQAAAQQAADPDLKRSFIQEGTTLFYADFFRWVNVVALVLQAFVASRMLRYGGFGAILLILPVISLVSYTAMAVLPVLAIVKTMKIAENATDYSLHNTARHVLWLPMSSEVKYKGKPTIDSLFVRVGDGLAALTVLVGVNVFALSTQAFFVVNVSLVVLWLLGALVVVQEHNRITRGGGIDDAQARA